MKNFKKLAAAAAALAMTATLAVPMTSMLMASADASEGTISFKGNNYTAEDHSYTAYKIFKGEASSAGFGRSGQATLEKIDWAEDVNSAELLSALKSSQNVIDVTVSGEENDGAGTKYTTLGALITALNPTTAVELSNILNSYKSIATAFADAAVRSNALGNGITSEADGTITVEEDGYYVIKETDNSSDDEAMTVYLLGVYCADDGAEIEVKSSTPSFEKYVKDVNDSKDTSTTNPTDWQKSADHDMNDMVDFRLEASFPSTYDDYKTYKYVFHDDIEDGSFSDVTFVQAYIDIDGDGKYDAAKDVLLTNSTTAGYTWSTGTCDVEHEDTFDCDFTCTIFDLKKVDLDGKTITAASKVAVEYKAKLTTGANLGSKGNLNEAYVEYSTNPNWNGEGDTEEREEKGETPHKKAIVFTYKFVVNKKDGTTGQALSGASFKLYKYDADANTEDKWIEVELVADGATFTATGLDDGEYKLVETDAPEGFNKIEKPIYFTVEGKHDADSLDLTELVASKSLTNTEGGEIELSASASDGLITTDIDNFSGATLPGTGGIGTTLFYLIGGTLVVGAGVTLITKKRMQKD